MSVVSEAHQTTTVRLTENGYGDGKEKLKLGW